MLPAVRGWASGQLLAARSSGTAMLLTLRQLCAQHAGASADGNLAAGSGFKRCRSKALHFGVQASVGRKAEAAAAPRVSSEFCKHRLLSVQGLNGMSSTP